MLNIYDAAKTCAAIYLSRRYMHVLSYYKTPKTYNGAKACTWNMHTQQALECDIAMSKHVRDLKILEKLSDYES